MSFLPQGFAQLADDDPFSDSHSVPDPPSLPPRPAPPPKPPHHHASPAPTAHAPSAPPANTGLAGNTFTIHLGVGVRDIPKLDAFSLSDPMVAVFDARTGREFGRTETIWNVKSADFQQELKVTYSPAQNTTLKFVVVDTDDEKTYDLAKQDLVGDVRVDLEGLVFQSNGNWVAFPIIHRRPKSGTLLLRVVDIVPGSDSFLEDSHQRYSSANPVLAPPPPVVEPRPPIASVPVRGNLTSRNSFDERASSRFAQDWERRDAEFRKMLGSRGWHEVPIKGDGACFFRSVSYLIFGTEERHGELRAKTMDYIESQSDFFAPFILEPLPGYVKRKRQPGEYANNVEIQAVACLLARNVEVYRYSMEPVTIEPFIYGEGDAPPPADRPLRLAYKHEVHYNAIVV